MKSLYTYVPPKNLKRLSGLIIILISATVGFFLFPTLFPKMPLQWLFQVSGILCMLVVIFVVVRYIFKSVVYSLIENEDGTVDLTVTELTNGGKTRIMVCRFDVKNIEQMEIFFIDRKEDAEAKKKLVKKAKKEHRKIFNYCPDMLSSPVCCIFANEGTEPFFVMISPDSELYNYLKNGLDTKEDK